MTVIGPQNKGLPGYRPGDQQTDPGFPTTATNPFADFRKNPGTRVTLRAHPHLTKKGLLARPFVFPAPPLNEMLRSLTYNWQDYDTISADQFSRPASMQLETISFDTLVVADPDGYVYPWAFYNPQNVLGWDGADVSRMLGAILRSATPIYLAIEEVNYKANQTGKAGSTQWDFGLEPVVRMLCTLRGLTDGTRAGEPDTHYLNVSFTEFRIPDAQQRAQGKGTAKSRVLPTTIAMRRFLVGPKPPEMTLHGLATYYYGSASMWTFIKSSNPWLGNVPATHDLSVWDTAALKAAGKANRKLALPIRSAGGRA